jgi:hypothetical protein
MNICISFIFISGLINIKLSKIGAKGITSLTRLPDWVNAGKYD